MNLRSIVSFFLSVLSAMLIFSCAKVDEPDYSEKEYGYVQFKLYKKASYTKSDAEDAANELVIKHRARMKELGYELDEEGRIIDFERKLKDDE